HYGFIVMTDPGSIGPKGRAARWRITDMAWGTLDGKPVEATKDYLHWDGVLFDRPQKQKNEESNASGCSKKCVTPDAPNASPPQPSDAPNATDGAAIITAPNASKLEHVPPQLNRGILVRRMMGESIGADSLLGAGRCRGLIPGTCVSE